MELRRRREIVVCAMLAGASCAGPDLRVTDQLVQWTDAQKRVVTRVENVGDANAGPFLVYVDGEEDPVSPNHRPQVRHAIAGLAVGDWVKLASDFAPLAHPDNLELASVHHVHTIVDPKGMVREVNEENNEWVSPTGPCDTVLSNLGLRGGSYFGGQTGTNPVQYQIVAQTFVMPQDGRLCGIELSLGRYDATESAVATLMLFEGDTLLATATKSGADVPLLGAILPSALDPLVAGIGHFDLSGANVVVYAGHSYRFELSYLQPGMFSVGIGPADYPDGTLLSGPPGGPLQTLAPDLAFKISIR